MSTLDAGEPLQLSPVRGRRLPRIGVDAHVLAQLTLALAASGTVGVALAATGGWKIPAALVAMSGLAVLGLLRPKIFLGLFLLTRPMVALISTKQLIPGVASANANGLTAMLLLLVLVGLVIQSKVRFRPAASAAMGVMLAFSAVAAVYAFATLGSRVGGNPISELIRLSTLLAMYLLAANLFASERGVRIILRLIALSAVAPATYGVVEFVSGSSPVNAELGFSRIGSTLGGNANTFAAYLATCGLVLISGRTDLPRWVRWPSLGLVLTALVATYSREGWLIFLLGILLLGWRQRRALAVVVLAGTAILVFAVPTVHNRVLPSNTKGPSGSVSSGAYASFQWRLENWRGLVDKFSQSPLVGYGLGSEIFVNPYHDHYAGPGIGWNSHNSLLTIVIEGGVLLLIPWLYMFGVLIGTCRRMARAAWDLRRDAMLAQTLWIALIAAGLITEDTLNETSLVLIIFALTGSLEGARRTRIKAARERSRAADPAGAPAPGPVPVPA